jgi:branched-chain amino acid transport system substrate-binding protein
LLYIRALRRRQSPHSSRAATPQGRPRARRPRRSARRTAGIFALLCLGTIFTSCGSRLSEKAIADAARHPIERGAGLGETGSASTAAGTSTGAPNASGASSSTGGSHAATGHATSGGGNTTGAATATKGQSSSTPGAAGSTIALGNVGTYSGVIGAVFSGAQQTIGVWQAYVNAHGGLNGHPVHVYIEDDGSDPSTSVSEVEQEVTQDHVIAFVGNLMPLTANASVPYLQQQNIPVIGGDASSAVWWQSPMLFPQASSAVGTDEADFTIKAAAAKGQSKMALLYCVEDPTCSNNVQQIISSTKAYGVDTVYSSSFSITQPDFTAQCIDAKQAGATFVYFAGDGDSLVRMSNNCAAQNYTPLYVGDSIAITANLASDPHLNGLLAGQTNFPWIDSFTPAQAAYQQAVKQYAPNLAGSATTAAEWSAGMLAVAASKALTASPTSAQFLQGLWSIKNNNLGGLAPPLSFNQNAPATPSNCYFLMTLQNGQFSDLNNGNTQCVS